MMRKGLFASAILVTISILAMIFMISMTGLSASAQESADAAFARAVRISGSLVGKGVPTAGTCTQGFSNQCPSGHSCTCFTVMGARFRSSKIGAGRANFFVTLDHTATFGTLGTNCMPLYGEIDAITKKDSPTFDVWGAACTDPKSNLAANGAMGLSSSNLFVVSGYATFTSTINTNSGQVVLRFQGSAQ